MMTTDKKMDLFLLAFVIFCSSFSSSHTLFISVLVFLSALSAILSSCAPQCTIAYKFFTFTSSSYIASSWCPWCSSCGFCFVLFWLRGGSYNRLLTHCLCFCLHFFTTTHPPINYTSHNNLSSRCYSPFQFLGHSIQIQAIQPTAIDDTQCVQIKLDTNLNLIMHTGWIESFKRSNSPGFPSSIRPAKLERTKQFFTRGDCEGWGTSWWSLGRSGGAEGTPAWLALLG